MSALRNELALVPAQPEPLDTALCTAENNARALWLRKCAKSENTRAVYTLALELFLSASGFKSVRAACLDYDRASASLAAFRSSLAGYSVSTQRVRLSAVRSLLVLCERERVYDWPVAHLLDPPEKEVRVPYDVPTQEQCLECIALEPSERNRTILRLLYYTGLRVSELVGLKWGDLRVQDGQLCAYVVGKGKKLGQVVFRPELLPDLVCPITCSVHAQIVPLSRAAVGMICNKAWKRIGVKAEKPGLGPHLWRHCHGTHAIQNGADAVKVQNTLRHGQLRTTQENYLHLAPESSGADLRWG